MQLIPVAPVHVVSRIVLMMTAAALACIDEQALGGPLVDIKIMSFNIKGDDGSLANRLSKNGWYTLFSNNGGRKDKAVSVINSYAPDLMGVEEMKQNQLTDLSAAASLTGFGYYGQGRDGGDQGDRNGIFYRASRFTPVDQGDFWLSSTPTVPGTTFTGGGTDTGNPRMATWMKLYDNQTTRTYFVLNTHWSLDSQAETLSGTFIRNQLNLLSGGMPLIVLGDFNTTLTSTALKNLTGVNNPTGFQLTDAYRHVFPSVSSNEATYHNFTGNTAGSSIDHIFYSAAVFNATAAEIVHTSFPNSLYPSDHFPVTTTLQVVALPEPVSATLLLVGCIALFTARRSVRAR